MNIKFVGKAKLTKQGQLTLPFEARQNLEIKSDNELYWYLVDDYLVVVKELINPKDLEVMLKKTNKKINNKNK
jgi:bifunctional DNA-binding transcriptional regulator/antitoxin component of YhaV-PrlF toxin-antitoxin module